MIALPLAPIWLLELAASLTVIILTFLSFRVSQRLVRKEPENALWLFLNVLALAFLVFPAPILVSSILQDLITYFDLPQPGAGAPDFRRLGQYRLRRHRGHHLFSPHPAFVSPHGGRPSPFGRDQQRDPGPQPGDRKPW